MDSERKAESTARPKSDPAADPAAIFRLLRQGAEAEQRGVLATIVALEGTGARSVGTHMAVLENGDSAGSFSSGCVEAAIVGEAREVLEDGRPRVVRFGQGSPYIDIRLPCGGGMDVLFMPDPSTSLLERIAGFFNSRIAFTLRIDRAGAIDATPGWHVESDDGPTSIRHAPPLKLVLLGHGAEMLAGLRLGLAHGAEVEVMSPEAGIVDTAGHMGVKARLLASPGAALEFQADPWTAMLFLFHDHDWEPPLLAAALETPAFWIGAMGSRSTHDARRAALARHGLAASAIDRVHGPVGLIASTRDPATLALSAFAEIVGEYRRALA